ncbi:uncharacterized protein LOC116178700 [Photinus pyralis]|nr:uncharacterized protein LOC116178700 [Photinus pyralis]
MTTLQIVVLSLFVAVQSLDTGGGGVNPDSKFECRTAGLFPDLFNTKIFHRCSQSDGPSGGLQHDSVACEDGYTYNARSASCDLPLGGRAGSTFIPNCHHRGKNGALDNNSSLYYICQYHRDGPLYPFVYACGNGTTYNSYLYLCV